MVLLCPECQQGKHTNCDGAAGLNDDNFWIQCQCKDGEHPNLTHFFSKGQTNGS